MEDHGHELAAGGNHGHHAADAGSGGLPQFDPTWFPSQVFWLAVMFAILYVYFSRKTLPDISSTLENRKNHIEADLETAEKLQAEAEQVQESYEQSLQAARDNAADTVAGINASIKEKAAEEYAAFQKRAENEIRNIEKEIAQAKAKVMDNMNDIGSEVAAEAGVGGGRRQREFWQTAGPREPLLELLQAFWHRAPRWGHRSRRG